MGVAGGAFDDGETYWNVTQMMLISISAPHYCILRLILVAVHIQIASSRLSRLNENIVKLLFYDSNDIWWF